MGKRIVTIDASPDQVLAKARTNHPNAILTNSLVEFVILVLAAAGNDKISQLDVIGHGHPGQIWVGGAGHVRSDTKVIGVSPTTAQLFNAGVLNMLTPAFESDAVVRLHACRVAHGRNGNLLLWQLADLWKVRVQGAIVTQFPDNADQFEGRLYVEASGSGSALGNVLRDRPIQ